jgi:hypothetical protein
LQIISRWTRPTIAELSVINFERARVTNFAAIVVEACLTIINAFLALILSIGIETVWALFNT